MNKYGTMVEWQLAQKNWSTGRTSPRATLFTTNLTRTALWSNPHLQRKGPATNHLLHGTPSWSVHVLRSLSCCWGHVSSSFSAALACEFRVPVVYNLTAFFALFLFQRKLFIRGILHSPVNITRATCTRTIYDVWTLLPARRSDTSTAGGLQRWQWQQWRRLPFWVALPKWSVKESPYLSWIHVVQGVRSVTFYSVNELNSI
jgi:hypothetical protein